MSRKILLYLTLSLLAVVHAWAVLTEWNRVQSANRYADFQSYYYAVQVAADGKDPYAPRVINAASRADGLAGRTHPYFYPPPFLLGMTWALPLDVRTAYRSWFWVDEAFALAALLVLAWAWRAQGPALWLSLGLLAALSYQIPHNHTMGQANAAVLLAALLGTAMADRDREAAGGALVGVACMMKMSPALLVLWWLLRGRFLAVGAAILTALVLSVLTLPLVDASTQLRFYTAVLPRFASGDYNGLTVPIDLWGNHSIPNVLHVLFPGAPNRLSPTAQELSRIVAIGALGIAAAAWWRPPTDDVARQGQIAAVFGIMLLLPVYTYEHHLLWQLPALAVAMAGLVSGRLHPGWTPIVVFAWIFFLWPTNHLKALSQSDTGGGWGPLLREAKFLGLLASTFAAGAVGRARPD